MRCSIVIPVYNCERYLKDCVDSVLHAELRDCEILLIDDGSQDKSGSICDEMETRYPNVRCVHQKNQGVSAARNQGLSMAVGQYILFLDSDDTLNPFGIRHMIDVLDSDPTIDLIVYGISFDFYKNEACYRYDEKYPPYSGMTKYDKWLHDLPDLYAANMLSSSVNKIFRRSFLLENHLSFRKDMFLYEDLEFSLRCMACCEKIYFAQEAIYHYRQAEDEGNAGRRLKRIDHISTLVEQIENAFHDLVSHHEVPSLQDDINCILLSLYLVLAREKIAVSNRKEIARICDDFSEWYNQRKITIPQENKRFTDRLLNRKIGELVFVRTYSAIRHKIAVAVKSTMLYQRLKG